MEALKPEYCRTVLFTPANRVDRYEKASKLNACDAVVLDLEDAVPLAEKDSARNTLFDYLSEHQRIPADHPMLTIVRVNSISTQAGLKDLSAMIERNIMPDAILLPKVQTAQEINIYSELLSDESFSHIPLIAAIETAYGLQYAHEIAACDRVIALGFGGADLAVDLGVELTFESTIAYRSRLVQAAKYAHKAVWDVPYLNIKDEKGLIAETKKIKALGYTLKIAIHPNQLAPIAKLFSPSEEEIQIAKKIVLAAENSQGMACQVDGKMIDKPVVQAARNLLQKAKLFNLTREGI